MGISNVLADALSMGAGEFLSSRAYNNYVKKELERETWELDNYPEGEASMPSPHPQAPMRRGPPWPTGCAASAGRPTYLSDPTFTPPPPVPASRRCSR